MKIEWGRLGLALSGVCLAATVYMVWGLFHQHRSADVHTALPNPIASYGTRPASNDGVAVKMCNQVAPHWTGVTAYVALASKIDDLYPVVCGGKEDD